MSHESSRIAGRSSLSSRCVMAHIDCVIGSALVHELVHHVCIPDSLIDLLPVARDPLALSLLARAR